VIASRRRSSRAAVVLVLIVAYVQVGLVLSDYSSVWAQPEEFEWREYILMNGPSLSKADVARGLNWRIFEYEPRSTRPLSHYFEIVDTKFRAALWTIAVPHPSLSLTWLFLLAATPMLFFALLRNLAVPAGLAGMITALYVANPGTLSLLAVDFRPAKPLANFAIVCAVWWASRIHASGVVRHPYMDDAFYGLCVFMLASFLVDETALLSFPAVLLLFPAMVFASATRVAAFFALPVVTYFAYFLGVPALSKMAGFDLPKLETYGPAAAATAGSSLRRFVINADVLRDLPTNLLTFLSDMFGLVNPALSRSRLYTALWIAVVLCVSAVVLIACYRAYLRGWRSLVGGDWIVWRSLALLIAVTFFANVMLHLVANPIWGLHWLNTFWPIFWLLFIALALRSTDLNAALATAATCFIITASVYNFTYVNNAFKTFFYYRTVVFQDVMTNRVNRFDIPREDGAALFEKTRSIWREHKYATRISSIPAELYYLVHDLRLIEPGITHTRTGTLFDGRVPAFDLLKEHGAGDKYFVVMPSRWARHVR
jgi:hypothetical protein